LKDKSSKALGHLDVPLTKNVRQIILVIPKIAITSREQFVKLEYIGGRGVN
jgi:hypothetical protein